MSGFTSKYASRPDCYGEEDVYDPDDEECRQCPHKSPCSLVITRREAQARREITSRNSQRDRDRRKERKEKVGALIRSVEDFPVGEPEEGDTFSTALVYNASLNALQGMVDTASHAVGQIPRKPYNMFTSLRKKKR